jgi:hypothetical protein
VKLVEENAWRRLFAVRADSREFVCLLVLPSVNVLQLVAQEVAN